VRYRKLDENGDMQFGHGSGDVWFNTADGVGQAVKTRLMLFRGEWFLDITEGMPWGGIPLNDQVVTQGQVLGSHTSDTRDFAIKDRVLSTPGVLSIIDYSSAIDASTRAFSASMKISTIYGAVGIKIASNATSVGFTIGVTPLDSGMGLL
jgi:hypothetical protein